MGILFNENAISSGNYIISNSLRFQSASSQYLSRTPSVTGNQRTFTWSGWVKRGTLGTNQTILEAFYGASLRYGIIYFTSSDTLVVNSGLYSTGASTTISIQLVTTQVFRDPSAWYHIVIAVDTTQATASNRVKIYVNGSQVTSFSTATYPALNDNTYFNVNTTSNYISETAAIGNGFPFDGYHAEINWIDGQALTPSSFGTTDPTSGQWVAKKYTGTYGTNGFYLPFSNGTSTTTLGADSSGNGNNWTLNNFTRSAGVSDCWMIDVPSGNGGASGTQPNSNYCVLNLLKNYGTTISYANLIGQFTPATAAPWQVHGTIGVSSGKWYWETQLISVASNGIGIGVAKDTAIVTANNFTSGNAWSYYTFNGTKYNTGAVAYGASCTTNDVIGVALDMDAGTITFYKNNVSQGQAFSGLTGNLVPYIAYDQSGTSSFGLNCGQRSFAYTPPSGYKALCTANLPVATIKQGNKYMDATTYSGNLIGQSITNAAGFKPDLVWVKSRSAATDNKLTDSVRGVQTALISNSTAAETTDLTGVVSFNTNGFTLGTSTTYNNTGATYVGWQWQAGQGTTSSNTNGSITSTVSVNATAGFSVVTYTGTGANATVGHGLGVAPKMVIVKNRNNAGLNWRVQHTSLTGGTYYLSLNLTDAQATSSTIFTAFPSSTVFSVGNDNSVNGNTHLMLAYCFAEIAGFSKFGSYTANTGAADGPFVYLGFRPKFILFKNSTAAQDWFIFDSSRDAYNTFQTSLAPDTSGAEVTGNTNVDYLSNGFKIRSSGTSGINVGTNTYIYMAFAENPFAQANAR